MSYRKEGSQAPEWEKEKDVHGQAGSLAFSLLAQGQEGMQARVRAQGTWPAAKLLNPSVPPDNATVRIRGIDAHNKLRAVPRH